MLIPAWSRLSPEAAALSLPPSSRKARLTDSGSASARSDGIISELSGLHHDSHNEAALREFKTVCSTVEDKKYASPSDRQLEQEAKAQIQQLDTKP